MAQKFQSELVYQSSTPFPAGRVTLAGTIRELGPVDWKRMRVLGSYALVYLYGGQGVYRDGRGWQRTVSAGDLIIVYPEVPHRYGPVVSASGVKSRWNEFYVVFDGAIFDAWRKAQLLREDVTIKRLMPIGYWHKRLMEVLPAGGGAEPLQVAIRLQQFLADALAHRAADEETEGDDEFLERAKRALELGEAENTPLPELARKLGMGYETFRKRFSALSGMSPNQYRMSRRIEHACQLMSRRPATLAEIARQTGFCDEFHFSRRFKAMTGMSPTMFRRQMGK